MPDNLIGYSSTGKTVNNSDRWFFLKNLPIFQYLRNKAFLNQLKTITLELQNFLKAYSAYKPLNLFNRI